jgi:glutathione S-transferase
MVGIILYTASNACSIAAHITLAEAGLDFEATAIDLVSGQQQKPEYLKLNPKGRVPVLVDGAFVLTEVPAIMRYAAVKSPAALLWPDNPVDDARCSEWLAWISSTVHPAFAHMRRPYRYADGETAQEEVSRKGRDACAKLWAEIDSKLAGRDYAVGKTFTVADAYLMVLWIWGRGPALGYDMPADFPNWTRHARLIAERPAVMRVFETEKLTLP